MERLFCWLRRHGADLFAVVACLALFFTAGSGHALVSSSTCVGCHSGEPFQSRYAASAHGANACTSCHRGITDTRRHMRGEERPTPVACGDCHGEVARAFGKNVHFLRENFQCADCHGEIHGLRKTEGSVKKAIVEDCSRCHSRDEYVSAGHAGAVLKGNEDAASCADCHGLHDTRAFHAAGGAHPKEARTHYTERCVTCHADADLVKRNRLRSNVVASYEQTYHGKVRDAGYPSRVAGCADCHRGHDILPKTDPKSGLHPANLEKSCGACHRGFHPRFASYIAHPDYHDRENYPALYWAFIFMEILLGGVFIFFWTHTALWWRKVYWEKHRREKEGLLPEQCFPGTDGHVQIQRFRSWERLMHVILIISFFTLILTGFPIKYPSVAWSKFLLGLWGGSEVAGFFHRLAAFVLIVMVTIVAIKGLIYFFPKGQGAKGLVGRVFGPESLVPNLKDIRDIRDMFLWFFNRGPMPKFERWTYWEKFDFWAVFWGMFAIGVSGLLLWKTEWSSWIVPGWVLNVATLVHSEEALLAALFIFTVHFFNTHFIPTKFPLDRLIFSGTYTLDEMKEQRPLEYERVVAEGRLDGLKREHPGLPVKLFAAVFGLGSLLLGLLLTALIVWAMLAP